MSPYRSSWEEPEVSSKKRAELAAEIDRVRREARALLAKLVAHQRLAVVQEWMAGYCRYCGVELRGGPCHCGRDE